MAGPGDLQAMLQELLDAASEALDTIPDFDATLDGAPLRQFTSPSTPEVDCCPMLAVWSPTLGEGARSPRTFQEAMRINRPALNVMVVRCLPVGNLKDGHYTPPTVAQLNAASAQHHADGWALWNHIWNLLANDLLFARCQDGIWQGAIASTPAGGCAGWTLSLTQQLDGYNEDLAT